MFGLHEDPDGVSVGPVHVHLLEHVELDVGAGLNTMGDKLLVGRLRTNRTSDGYLTSDAPPGFFT